MNILVVGGGAREHALCWAIGQSPLCKHLYCAPGNAGIATDAICLPIEVEEQDILVDWARDHAIDFVVVGSEVPLVAGMIEQFEASGIAAFGPTAEAAQLESSKVFMKNLCVQYGIPTASFQCFQDHEAAYAYIHKQGVPIVIKADGLAAGKGVTVARTIEEASIAVDKWLSIAGTQLVIEECLIGEEVSFFALVDGSHVLALASAQDHKTVFDNDQGPNTGGMGACSPVPFMTAELESQIMSEIIEPIVHAMAVANKPFKGVLYAGLMILSTPDGLVPTLLECNVRFGDPECQVLMVRLRSDILPALIATRDGVLDTFDLRWRSEAAVGVVLATKGYPGKYIKGTPIYGLDALTQEANVFVFHAATARGDDTQWFAQGGRVLTVTAIGTTVLEARERVYKAIDRITWPEGHYRRDIGYRAVTFCRPSKDG